MLIEKDCLIVYLLERLYVMVLKIDANKSDDYERGYIKGFKDCIEEVNKYQENINKKGGI
ncbi:hypothetical protein Q3V94_04000 [Caloramator sp. CAR-1]|uniref:hypothetical protein n=1 Tax=Caloramator sp. CAR-1 TaxID=3062777 RepID=UPI0026E1D1B3|nr:hypothetical protein [Caloramator sp. CAR-1]MDO6354247.1 hypothetical protein [Caloramator sp. CAR-1]